AFGNWVIGAVRCGHSGPDLCCISTNEAPEHSMDWRGRRKSSNIEDRRGEPMRAGAGGGLLLLMRIVPWLLRSRGGRVVLAVGVVAFFGARMMGIDLLQLGGPAPQQTASLS